MTKETVGDKLAKKEGILLGIDEIALLCHFKLKPLNAALRKLGSPTVVKSQELSKIRGEYVARIHGRPVNPRGRPPNKPK